MPDLYLRTADAAAMLKAIDAAGLISDGIPIQASHGHALDMIGTLPGKTGYHANLRVWGEGADALTEAVAGVTIAAPLEPKRVWA